MESTLNNNSPAITASNSSAASINNPIATTSGNNSSFASLYGVSHSVASAVPVVATVSYAKPFPNISKIEMFGGQNFKRWQERILLILDMFGVAATLTYPKPGSSTDPKHLEIWTHADKVCRHTISSTLANDLFDIYCPYKEAKDIWDSMKLKHIAKDAGKQKFVIDNFYRWEMTDDKDIKMQINEYHKLLEDLKAENINLQDEFIAGLLIEKLPRSWKDYKQQLKHKHKQLSLANLTTHVIIEDTNRKELKVAESKEMASKVHLVQDKFHKQNKRYNNKKPDYKPKTTNSISIRREIVLFVESQVIMHLNA
ncbi:uncharacterized protein LOC116130020 [Pistacia vera]|uniref:uncharacterized protein LOC116130020 n=1 Tax=Pistacia vera TaxID=55513 RepID=UPI001262C6EB|nr:uncharacterized protein LOC116130020 [Pistacia vera]